MNTISKTRYEEMFPEEFKASLVANPIAYLPLGSMEYHGYHNVLGLDSLKAWKICELAATKIGGIVFPPLYLGVDIWPDLDLQKYPNKQYDCYHLDAKLYKQVLENYFYRIIRIGFKKIFVLAGHYPNTDIAKLASKKYAGKDTNFVIVNESKLVKGETGDHAGKWETSLMMAMFPELVNLKRMNNKANKLRAIEGIDPLQSSKEYGQKMLDNILDKIVKLLK